MGRINWPTRWNSAYYTLFRRAKTGEFGHIYEFRFRAGRAGPKEIGCDPYFVGWLYDANLNGSGALIDFGGYGAVMAIDLLGRPDTVLAVRKNFTKDYPVVDDHAVIVLGYLKAVAVLEATWAQCGSDGAPNPILYGTEATAGVYEGQLRIPSPRRTPCWGVSQAPSRRRTQPCRIFPALSQRESLTRRSSQP